MSYIDPGQLTETIEIVAIERSRNANGRYVTADKHVCTARAHVWSVSGKDEQDAYAETHREHLRFTVRWDGDRLNLNTDMVVIYKKRRYAIERMDVTPYENGYRRIWGISYLEGVGVKGDD